MRSAKADAAELIGPCRSNADKQRGHKGRAVGSSRRLPYSWGRIDRRLTSSEATRAMGSAEAEASEQLGPYRPKDDIQRGPEGRGVGRSRAC